MLDPVLLESFLAVSQARSFSEAGRRLGLRQSTISQHIRKLEQAVGRRLFIRDTHSVVATPDGEAMDGFARTILETQDRAQRYFASSELRGRVRFGASEDFVTSHLPEVLAEFVRMHPRVDLTLTVGVSAALYQMLDAGDLDLVLCKRRSGDERGWLVWRDQLAWIGTEGTRIDPAEPVPLILYTPPSITRTVALATLEQANRSWRIVCSSGSLSGLRAAVLAGLGVTVHARGLIPEGLSEMPTTCRLPDLGDVEFVVLGVARHERGPAAELAGAILASGGRLQRRV